MLISAALGALVLALSEGLDVGVDRPADRRRARRRRSASARVFVRRSRRHPNPVVDLTLFADRSFVIANIATFVYAAGFFAMLLGNILFLTSVWHYSIMQAGLAVTPGPLVVASSPDRPASWPAASASVRCSLLGAACFAVGLGWYVAKVDATPAYLAHWLPGTLIVGLGIGLTFPVLSAAAVSSLPAGTAIAVGSAVNQTARQVGGAIGIAVLVMLLGTPTGAADAVGRFHHVWIFGAITAVLSGLIGALIPKPHAHLVELTPELPRRSMPSSSSPSTRSDRQPLQRRDHHEDRRCSSARHRRQPRARRRRSPRPSLDSGAKVYGAARDTDEHHEPRRHPGPARRDQRRRHRRRRAHVRRRLHRRQQRGHPPQSASLADGGVDAARAEMETNFFGSMRMARAFAPVLRDNGGGALVNVLSVLSFISMPQGATYSASKAAAWSLTNALRIELRRQGTLVVAVHAGFIDTDMAAGVSGEKVSPESVAQQIVDRHRKPTPRRSSPMPPARWSKRRCPTISPRCIPRSRPSGTRKWRSSHERRTCPRPTASVVQGRHDPHGHGRRRRFRLPRSRPEDGQPVIFLTHLAANLDNWDPRVVDGIAAKHRVITFDNRGVGASTGKVPDTIEAMAASTRPTPYRSVEVRAEVELTPDPDKTLLPKFAEHYGVPVEALAASGDDRVIATFKPVRVVTNG